MATPLETRPPLDRLRSFLKALGGEDEEGWVAADVLAVLASRFRTLGRLLVLLSAYEPDPAVHRRASFLLLAAVTDQAVPATIRQRVITQAGPHALKGLSDADLDDERKMGIASFVGGAGLEPPGGDVRACFRDFDALMAKSLRAAGTELGDEVEALHQCLEGLLLGGRDAAVTEATIAKTSHFAFAVLHVNPGPGAALAAAAVGLALEHRIEEVGDAQKVLAAAAAADPGRLLWMLGELATWPASGGIAAGVCETVEGLRREGARPRAIPAPPLARAFVTSVDGAGSRGLTLLLRRDDGALDALMLLLNDRQGVKDIWTAWASGADIEESYRSSAIPIAPCDLPFARALLQDAFHTHRASGRPFPARLLVLKAALGPEALDPAPREPRLGSYGLELLVPSASLADGSETLTETPPFADLGFDSDAAFAFVLESGRRRRFPAPEALVDGLLEAVEGVERERVTRRLAVNLELEALAGRGRRKPTRLAAATWLVLAQGLAPFREIPYVRALAEASIPRIAGCLACGFTNQDEANEASLHEPDDDDYDDADDED